MMTSNKDNLSVFSKVEVIYLMDDGTLKKCNIAKLIEIHKTVLNFLF